MNIRDLTYLINLCQLKHFGQAAVASFVSQPALSMQIKKLEEELGVQLIERTNKQVIMTPVGESISEIAEEIIYKTKMIKEIAKSAQDPFSGTITIGAFPTLAPYFFPRILAKIKKAHPKITMHLVEEKTDRLIEKLVNGKLDAAFLAMPIHHPMLEVHPLFTDPFYLAVPKNHRLANHKRVSAKEISHEAFLLLDEGHCLRDQALSFCSTAEASEDKTFRATSLETLRQMIAAGVGITLIPEIAIQKNSHIVYIPFEKSLAPARQICMVWRKQSHRARCLSAVIKEIKKHAL